jgi:O-antigen/teichoic acid export membrane protein
MRRDSPLRNNIFLFGSESTARALALVLVVVAVRWLGPEEYGRYAWAVAFAELLKLFVDLGTHQLLVREVAARPARLLGQLRATLKLKAVVALVVLALVFLIGWAAGYRADMRPIVGLALVAMVLNSYAELWQAVFRGLERMSLAAAARFVHAVFRVGVGVVVVVAGGGVRGLITVYLLSALVHFVLSWALSRGPLRQEMVWAEPPRLSALLREAAPLSLVVVFVTLYSSLGRLLVGFMRSDVEVGWYDAAFKLVGNLGVVASVVSQVALPVMSRSWGKAPAAFGEVVEKSFKFLVSFALPLGVGGSLLGTPLVLFFYGRECEPAGGALAILAWVVSAIFMSSVFYHLLIATRRQRLLAYLTGVGALANLVLNLVAIPLWGFMGAAVSALITEVGILVGVAAASAPSIKLGRLARLLPRPLAGCLFVAGVCLLLGPVHPLAAVLISVPVYVGFLLISGYVEKDEIAAVRRLTRGARV